MIGSKYRNAACTFEVLLLVLLTFSPVIPQVIKIGLTFLLLLLGLVKALKTDVALPVDKTLLVAIACFAFPVVLDIFNTFNGQPYSWVNLMYPCYFVCGYFVAKKYDKGEFYTALERITFVCAILSLVGMSVYFIKPSLIYSLPTYVMKGQTHRTIFFFNYLFSGNWMAVRNSGIAWEPGAFQILLNIAFQLSIQKHEGKKLFVRVCLYSLAIVLTRSTIGFFILAINLFCLVRKHKKYLGLVIAVGLIGSAFIVTEIIYQIQYKLWGSLAFSARYTPMINAIRYAWYRPFGLGSTHYDAIYEVEKLGSFDCYTQMLLRFGYPLMIYVICRLLKIFRKDSKYISIILIISFLSEPVWGHVLLTAMYYLEDKKQPRVSNGEQKNSA